MFWYCTLSLIPIHVTFTFLDFVLCKTTTKRLNNQLRLYNIQNTVRREQKKKEKNRFYRFYPSKSAETFFKPDNIYYNV